MNAGNNLKRTNKTNLLDEELLILDVLFDSSDTFESLIKENYASWHNLPYSHNVETRILRDLIDKLIQNGIIESYIPSPGNITFHALTEAGGKLWEMERAPDWERYCTDYSTEDEDNNWTLFVESPSLTTVKAFVDCAADCLLYRFNQSEIGMTTLNSGKISGIGWRTFPAVYSISVATDSLTNPSSVDWNEYESKRTWWRVLTELARFQVL